MIPYADIPDWPASAVVGHPGTAGRGTLGLTQGPGARRTRALLRRPRPAHDRVSDSRAGRPRRVKRVDPDQCRGRHQHRRSSGGALMVIDDHINFLGSNPLIGANDERLGPRFPDMTFEYRRACERWLIRRPWRSACPSCTGSMSPCTGPATRRRPRSAPSAPWARMPSGMSTVPEAIVRAHGPRGARHLVHQQYGCGGAAGAAAPRRGDGDDPARARPSSSRCSKGSSSVFDIERLVPPPAPRV